MVSVTAVQSILCHLQYRWNSDDLSLILSIFNKFKRVNIFLIIVYASLTLNIETFFGQWLIELIHFIQNNILEFEFYFVKGYFWWCFNCNYLTLMRAFPFTNSLFFPFTKASFRNCPPILIIIVFDYSKKYRFIIV